MKLFKGWTKFEKTLLFGSIFIIGLVGIIFKSDILTTSCSVVGVITAFLHAKGKNLGQVFGLLITALYSVVSFRNKYYGENKEKRSIKYYTCFNYYIYWYILSIKIF